MGEARRRGTFEERRASAIRRALPSVSQSPRTAVAKGIEDIPEEVLQKINKMVKTPRVEKGNPILLREIGGTHFTMFVHPDDYNQVVEQLGGVLL